MSANEIEAMAKASEEEAKTVGKAIDAARAFGAYFDRLFGEALVEFGGMVTDQVKFWRFKNILSIKEKYEAHAQNGAAPLLPHDASPRFFLEFIDAASKADNESIQNWYARLLLSASTASSPNDLHITFVSILRELRSLDVLLLEKIYAAPVEKDGGVYTYALPDRCEMDDGENRHPTLEVAAALCNLMRVGCISSGSFWSYDSVQLVKLTGMGKLFVEACRPPEKKATSPVHHASQ